MIDNKSIISVLEQCVDRDPGRSTVFNMWYEMLRLVMVCVTIYVLIKWFSKEPSRLKFNFNFFLFYFLMSCAAVVFLPFFLLRPKNVRNSKVAAKIVKHITKLYGLRWELRNGHILAEDRGAVVVSNHQSSFDILGMLNIWEVADKLSAIAKKEIFYVWPFGLAAYMAGVVFIDRSNSKNAYRLLKSTSEIMVKNKTKLWLFPEGTRNHDLNRLLPFKRGAFKIAVDAQVPIIPVVYSPYYFINAQKYLFNKGHVIMKILEPVPTTGLKDEDVPELMNRIQQLMEEEYRKLSNEVLDALSPDYPLPISKPKTR